MKRRIRSSALVVLASVCIGLALAVSAGWSQPFWSNWLGSEKDVPYVPTTPEVVSRMLELADLEQGDVLYDLGSGDGRIVIAAAQEYGVRAVGIDIDPALVSESRANAREEGVDGKVAFREGNLFEEDISEATALTMYLLQDVNLRLRPRLLQELRPGTRIVSHAFDLGEWEPDETVYEGASVLYKWVVPANVSGVWRWTGPGGSGGAENSHEMRLDQEFQKVSGAVRTGGAERTLHLVTLEGEELSFRTETLHEGRLETMNYRGTVRGDAIEGTATPAEGGQSLPWRATRDSGTATPLDSEAGE